MTAALRENIKHYEARFGPIKDRRLNPEQA